MATKIQITVGGWRSHEEPMQVISGPIGKEKIHFEAPPSAQVRQEMRQSIQWFNNTAPGGAGEIRKGPIRAAIAHLYFETIHSLEDGNGRIGRALAEKALSQTIGRPVILSFSSSIEANKKEYYSSLEKAQKSNEITPWIEYFVTLAFNAQTETEKQIDFTLKVARFFDRYAAELNNRQQTVIRKMIQEQQDGFPGGMNARKYIGITNLKSYRHTRYEQLVGIGAFVAFANGGGRSTSYQINW